MRGFRLAYFLYQCRVYFVFLAPHFVLQIFEFVRDPRPLSRADVALFGVYCCGFVLMTTAGLGLGARELQNYSRLRRRYPLRLAVCAPATTLR